MEGRLVRKEPREQSSQHRIKTYRISRKEREYFMTNLAILMKASVPIGEALSSMMETLSKSSVLHKALAQIIADIDQGVSLSDALERSGIVPKQTLTMVRFGEKSGKLASNLQVAAEQERKQNIFRSKVRSAMMYPSFVFVVIIVVGLSIAWFLLPKLAVTFTQMKIELPLISKVFLGFGQFLGTNGIWFVPTFLVSLFAMIYIVFFAPGTKSIGQFILRHTPGISRLIQEIEIARFGYLFGTLLSAGVSVVESLELLRDATTHTSYKKLYIALR
jgi:type II secretory pathway component PulF